MTQPATKYFFSPDIFKRIREFKPELELEEAKRMIKHKDHVIAGLKAFQTKLIRTLNRN